MNVIIAMVTMIDVFSGYLDCVTGGDGGVRVYQVYQGFSQHLRLHTTHLEPSNNRVCVCVCVHTKILHTFTKSFKSLLLSNSSKAHETAHVLKLRKHMQATKVSPRSQAVTLTLYVVPEVNACLLLILVSHSNHTQATVVGEHYTHVCGGEGEVKAEINAHRR